jgi:ESS family glutamate:Na+ symporter
MIVEVPFLIAVALAGIGAHIGKNILNFFPSLLHYTPEPLLGGLVIAAAIVFLRLFNLQIQVPVQGDSVDFLIALITTNMGLHITASVLRKGTPLFLIFFGFGVLLFFLQLIINLPVAAFTQSPLSHAIVSGPLSFVGAPFNLNPPDQTAPVAHLFSDSFPHIKETAQGTMMIGVLGAAVIGSWLGNYFFRKAGVQPPKASFDESSKKILLTQFSDRLTALIVLILSLIAISFLIQYFLLQLFPSFRQDYCPVIVISFLLGAFLRLIFPLLSQKKEFAEDALTVLLIGPTMNLVLTYAIMSIPLHLLSHVTPALLIGGLLSVAASLFLSIVLFHLFTRLTNKYYAAVTATAFFALTTGWGPLAMSFLRQFVHTRGDVEPMPVIMPLNAFYIFPWMVIFLIKFLL